MSYNSILVTKQTLTLEKDDGLDDHHCRANLVAMPVKKDQMLDLLTIMSDRISVNVKVGENKLQMERG